MKTYDDLYIEFLAYFNSTRDYFECHEVLEEIWKEEQDQGLKVAYQALLQVAVALYHWRRHNDIGATKTFVKALKNIEISKASIDALGVDVDDLVKQSQQCMEEIEQGKDYRSINLKLDNQVLPVYEAYCQKHNLPLYAVSDLSDTFLVNKHSLRKKDEVTINNIIKYMEHFHTNVPNTWVARHSIEQIQAMIEEAIKDNEEINFKQ